MLTKRCKQYVGLFGTGSAFAVALSAWPLLVTHARPRATESLEEGTFRLHKFEQSIGEEEYSVQHECEELQLSVNFH